MPSTSTGTTVYDVGTNFLTARNHYPGPLQVSQSVNGSVVTTLGVIMYVLYTFSQHGIIL